MKTPGHARPRSRTAMAFYAVAGSCTLVAVVYTVSTTDDALTLAVSITVALVPLLIASVAVTGWQLVRRRRKLRWGRRELLVTLAAMAAVIVIAVAAGAAGYYLTS